MKREGRYPAKYILNKRGKYCKDFNQLFCPLRTSALTPPLDRHLTDKGPAMGPLVFGPECRRLPT
jgi:hypothetical protein